MTIPNLNFTILSNGLGVAAPSPAGVLTVFGCSSAGTANTVQNPYLTSKQLIDAYGYGPGPDAAANLIDSGIPTIFVKTPSSTVGTAGSVTHTGTGVSVMTVTGTPLQRYDVVVTTARSGTAGSDPEPGFTISLDGGVTTSGEIRMPSNHIYSGLAATTGITLNFTAATMVLGDTYTFSTTAPEASASEVATAIAALKNANAITQQSALLWTPGSWTAAEATTITAAAADFIGKRKFPRIVIETRGINGGETEAQWMTAIENDYAAFQSNLAVISAGEALVTSSINGVALRRNIAVLAMVRAGLVKIGRDLAAVEDGALVPKKNGVPVTTVYHDEEVTPGLDADRFMTIRSLPGLIGYYITNPNLMAAPTSDFSLLQYGRVMDEAARIARDFFTQKLSTDVRLNQKTGFILEKDARALESGCDTLLEQGLVANGNASAIQTIVSRTDNISSTKTLTVTITVLPLGYLKSISLTLSFVNPAIGTIAA